MLALWCREDEGLTTGRGRVKVFTKKPTASNLVEKKFRELVESLNGADDVYMLAVANTARSSWELFNVRYESAESFVHSSEKEKALFLDQHAAYVGKIEEEERNGSAFNGSTVGVVLSHMYFSALAFHDSPELINEIADFIEPLYKTAFYTLPRL